MSAGVGRAGGGSNFAAGYGLHDGRQLRSDSIFTGNTPARSLSATAAEMVLLMRAHLQDGRYGHAVILQPATTQQMHTRHYTADPRLHGKAHGFFEGMHNGRRTLGHDGSMFIFSTGLPAAGTRLRLICGLQRP